MIAVRNDERQSAGHLAADEKHRRKRLAFLNSLEVSVHMRFVTRQKRQLGGAQQILCGVLDGPRASAA